MQIHELNDFIGALDSTANLAVDNGNDTGKVSVTTLLEGVNNRISNIITSPAPTEQEIIDARLGNNNVVYPSLGDAIRGQISNIDETISPALGISANLLDTKTTTSNVYISNTNGNEVSYNGWKASDYIPIKPLVEYRVLYVSNGQYQRASGQNLYWAIYDENKSFLRGGIGDGAYASNPTATYLRVSCPNSYFNNQIMVMSDADAASVSIPSDYIPHMTMEALVEKIDSLTEESNEKVIYNFSNSNISAGYVRYWTGVVDTSGMYCTDYLNVEDYQGMIITVRSAKPAGNNAGLAFYDKSKTYISGIDYDDVGNVSGAVLSDFVIQVPKKAAYIRASINDNVINDFAILLNVPAMATNIYKYMPLLGLMSPYWTDSTALGQKVYLSDQWKENAEQAYNNVQDYLKSTNAYDSAVMLIETDSHGQGTLAFNWMQEQDDTIRCVHLGDIVDDYYTAKQVDHYYQQTKECKKIITIVGNHDVSYHAGEQGNQYDLIKKFHSTDRRIADPRGCFSVVDYDQRLKYICLNPYQILSGSSECAITPDQMTWFLDELNNSDFDIVILSHNPINDNDLVDRNGNSGSAYIGGPYAVGYNVINRILIAFKNKTTDTIETSEYGTIVCDFTNSEIDLIGNFAGHTHHELYKTSPYLIFVANWYGNAHSCTFVVIDKTNKKVVTFQFNNSNVYSALTFDY